MSIEDLKGLKAIEIGKDGVVAMKGSCKASDFKKKADFTVQDIFNQAGVDRL